MSRDEVRKLLGGYATGTLTQAEQEALFAAALEDQELFEALVKEQPVRDLLHDPAARAELLAALDGGEKRAWWRWRPLIAGVAMAGIAAVVTVVAWRGSPGLKRAPVMVAELKVEEPRATIPATRGDQPAQPAAAPAAGPLARARKAEAQAKPQKDVIASSGNLTSAVAVAPAAPAPAPAAPPTVIDSPAVLDGVRPSELVRPSAAMPFRANESAPAGAAGGVPPVFGARVANQAAQQGQQGAQAQQAQQVNSQALTVEVAASVASISDKKAAAAVQCTILRGANEVGLGTLLDAGETVRLRLVPVESGRVVVWEGAKIFVSAEVEKGKAFDTPPLAFLGSGARTLRVFFSRVPGELPVVVPVTITYK